MKRNILETIGQTPLVQLNKLVESIDATVCAKLEFFNPGLSTKDRIVMKIITDAEERGLINGESTLIDATSGNTGISIAMAAKVKGYKCILCVKDSIAEEKMQMLKSLEAEVVLCPAGVDPEHPDSYYSKAEELSDTIPNAFYVNQNFNPLNKQAHYETTGPEIWKQSQGKVTHLIASCSTGGTLSGSGRFLKEMNSDIKVYGVDTEGSVLKPFHEHGTFEHVAVGSSKISGVGKNIITDNVDFEIIDEFIRVDVKGSTILTKRLLREDGIWAGHSSGAVLQALFDIKDTLKNEDLVVLIFPDHGSRYVHKLYNNGLSTHC